MVVLGEVEDGGVKFSRGRAGEVVGPLSSVRVG